MNDWNEEDFLERLMRQPQHDAEEDTCPDSDSLRAFAEDRVRGVVRDAIRVHLAGCRDCADLHSRLLAFAGPAVAVAENEWNGSEKRLDNWMEAFLAERARLSATAEPRNTPARTNLKTPRGWRNYLLVQWVFGAVGALVLVVSSISFLRLSPFLNPKTETAGPLAPKASHVYGPSEIRAIPAARQPEGKAPARVVVHNSHSEHPTMSTERKAPPAGAEQTSAAETAAIKPPNTGAATAPGGTSTLATNIPPSVPIRAGEPTQSPPGRIRGVPATSVSASSRLFARSPEVLAPPRRSAVANVLAQLRLGAGTRLWISIRSFARQSDGSFKFHGVLFEPVSLPGVTTLDRGAEVYGFEMRAGGENSLVITDFLVRGGHYTLKDEIATTNGPAPGSASSVPFQGQQVQEMFIQKDSIYERAAGPAEPQK